MATASDAVLDGGPDYFLSKMGADASLVYTVGEAASYAEAITVFPTGKMAGEMPNPTMSPKEAGVPDGRQVRKLAQTSSQNADYDSAPDEVTHYAVVHKGAGNEELLITGPLVSPITTNNTTPIEVTADFVVHRVRVA